MKNIVVMPFNIPFDWSTDYLNQTAIELSKKGSIVICYLWGDAKSFKEFAVSGKHLKLVTKDADSIYLINPIYFIPFRRFKCITNLNSAINILFFRLFAEIISLLKGCKNKIFWIFDPNLIYLYKYFGSKYFLLYDCVDFFGDEDKENIEKINLNESHLCEIADLVVANSHILKEHLSKFREDVKLVPQGFRISDFERKSKTIKLDLKKPVIGFVGAVNARLDYNLLFNLARRNPNWNFVIWGPLLEKEKFDVSTWNKMQELFSLPNVKTGASRDKKEIPSIISQFDIGIIPYDISQNFNKYCYPMKLFEYFYMGIPVISTPIKELLYFKDLVIIEKDYKNWQKKIEEILSKPWPINKKYKQRILANKNSWKNKIIQIRSAISE